MCKYLLAVPLLALAALADEPNTTADSGPTQIKINVGEKRAICVGCDAPI
jgi:hypothetical protein